MQKISGIVPSSQRVATVDMKNAAPVRPGTPSFGRPIGVSSLSKGEQLTTAQKAMNEHRALLEKRRQSEILAPKIVTSLADQFFMKKSSDSLNKIEDQLIVKDFDLNYKKERPSTDAPVDVDRVLSREVAGWNDDFQSTPKLVQQTDEAQTLSQDESLDPYAPPGTYLDVTA